MSQTRREKIIIDDFVLINIGSRNKNYYNGLGYSGEYGESIYVRYDDLLPRSKAKVRVSCPLCGEERETGRNVISMTGHTLCERCGTISDIRGISFGLLTAIRYTGMNDWGALWECQCDCGGAKVVPSRYLTQGIVSDCGCVDKKREYGSGNESPNWQGGGVIMVCEHCGERYEKGKWAIGKSRFCSNQCKYNWQGEHIRGENHPMWNPTLSDEQRVYDRNYPEYLEFIKFVLARDGYTCRVCHEYGGELNVHHLYSYKHYPKKRTDTENGITLCYSCHSQFHTWMGGFRVKCTEDDFYEWLS